LSHEIGHQALNHVSPPANELPAQTREKARQADRFAPLLLLKLGYSIAPMISGMTYFAAIEGLPQPAKRNRFSEEQIISILKDHEAGISVADLCRKHGVSDASIYKRSRAAERQILSSKLIAVGTPITERPPHRSVRAGFPHTAPTSGV
jgi:putative transposase